MSLNKRHLTRLRRELPELGSGTGPTTLLLELTSFYPGFGGSGMIGQMQVPRLLRATEKGNEVSNQARLDARCICTAPRIETWRNDKQTPRSRVRGRRPAHMPRAFRMLHWCVMCSHIMVISSLSFCCTFCCCFGGVLLDCGNVSGLLPFSSKEFQRTMLPSQ